MVIKRYTNKGRVNAPNSLLTNEFERLSILSTAEIISLVASICAAVSAIAAVISCFVHYRFTKPKIKVEIQQSRNCYYFYSEVVDEGRVRAAYMPVRIYNSSAVGGTIAGIEFEYIKSRYSVETTNSNYHPWFKIPSTDPLKQDQQAFRLKVPLIVPAYSAMVGYFLFPDFPIINDKKIFVTVKVKIIEGRLKVRKIKNVLFEEQDRFLYTFPEQTTNTVGASYAFALLDADEAEE